MGYSYNDFVTKAKGAGMLKKFSQEDLSIAQRSPEYGMSMLGLMQDERNATTAEGRLLAQEAAKTLRNNYVLKGQVAAKQAEINGVGSFTYDKDDEISALQDKIVNQEVFSYDHEKDPLYKSMRQTAIRDSQRAVEDTLARASVGTGGVPSSYAVAAAQQAANNYLGQLDDAVPTLYQNALAKYENDLNMNLKRLAALEGDRDTQMRLHQDGLDRLGSELDQLKASAAAGDTSYFKILQQLQEQLENGKGPEDYYETDASGRPIELTGHGLLTNTGNETEVKVTTNAGKTGVTSVPVMQAQDGTLWYWDHMQHKYVPASGNGAVTPGAPVTETENTTLFRNTVMTPNEFRQDRSEGKEGTYKDYLLATLERWHAAKKISDNELAWLMNYYKV